LKNEILLLKRKVRTGIAKPKIKEKEKREEKIRYDKIRCR